MVTAELALALPAVILAAALVVAMLSAVAAQLRALDAAAVAARLAARGEPAESVHAAVRTVAGGATLVLRRSPADVVAAEVSLPVPIPLLGGALPGLVVHERAVAPVEPSAGPS